MNKKRAEARFLISGIVFDNACLKIRLTVRHANFLHHNPTLLFALAFPLKQ